MFSFKQSPRILNRVPFHSHIFDYFLFLLWYFTAKIATGYLNVQYPPAQRDETNFYTYNGTQKVYDPYPWLEEETSATEKFIKNQNQLAEPFITKNNQFKEIKKLCANLANYPKFSVPERIGKYYFTFENSGLQDQE